MIALPRHPVELTRPYTSALARGIFGGVWLAPHAGSIGGSAHACWHSLLFAPLIRGASRLTVLGVLLGVSLLHAAEPGGQVERTEYGRMPDGAVVDLYTLTNSHGLEARVMTLGATLLTVKSPDRPGPP